MIRVGVIGYGYWGPNLVRNLAEIPTCQVAAVSELRKDRRDLVSSRYPAATVTADSSELIRDPRIDAILVATPLSAHYALALEALQAGKHVLVEKPLAGTSAQVRRLQEEAARRRLVLMVDHTFVYTSAVESIRKLVADDKLGSLYYYDSVRVNLGLFQHDVDVIWDLAVHDLAIMDHVLGRQPRAVSASGMKHIGEHANIAYLTLAFDDRLIGHVHVNWLAPVKIRRTLIGGSRRMIVYDDLEPSEKVKVYDRGVTLQEESDQEVYQMMVNYRLGDMWVPHLGVTEALQTEMRHFLRCIEHSERPVTDAEAGLRVVKILEAASQSMAEHGRTIELDASRATP